MARNYWLTVHWPPYYENDDNPYVWLQPDRVFVGNDMAKGDRVAVYEYLTGPPERIDGLWAHRRQGVMKIVWHGVVTERLPCEPEPRIFWRYGDVFPMEWIQFAKVQIRGHSGVGLGELNDILGYSPNSVLRGFGEYQSGLKKVTRDQFERMIR